MADEQGSVVGGLGEAWDAAGEALNDLGSGIAHGADGVGEFAYGAVENVASGFEFMADEQAGLDMSHDAMAHRDAAVADFNQAGSDVAEAGHDVVGDVEIDPSMLYNEAE